MDTCPATARDGQGVLTMAFQVVVLAACQVRTGRVSSLLREVGAVAEVDRIRAGEGGPKGRPTRLGVLARTRRPIEVPPNVCFLNRPKRSAKRARSSAGKDDENYTIVCLKKCGPLRSSRKMRNQKPEPRESESKKWAT